MKKGSKSITDIDNKFTITILFISVIAIWVLCWVLIANSTLLIGWDTKGQFGDMFGSVNALFSGLAFAAITYTILLQRHDLKLTREEFIKQSQEFEKQTKILKDQTDSEKEGRNNELFFKILEIYLRNKQLLYENNSLIMSDFPDPVSTFLGIETTMEDALIQIRVFQKKIRSIAQYRLYYNSTSILLQFIYSNRTPFVNTRTNFLEILSSQMDIVELKLLFYNTVVSGSMTDARLFKQFLNSNYELLRVLKPVEIQILNKMYLPS